VAAVIALKDRTGRARAYTERKSCQQRLQRLAQQLENLDHNEDRLQRVDVRVAMRRVFDVMAECDEILSPLPDPVLPALPSAATEERAMRHHRMQTLLQLLDDLPKSCTETARALRRALQRELCGPSLGRIAGR
jgi:hypothetical protein